jgi:hypothetical protein
MAIADNSFGTDESLQSRLFKQSWLTATLNSEHQGTHNKESSNQNFLSIKDYYFQLHKSIIEM